MLKHLREALLAVGLVVAGLLVVSGVSAWSEPLARIVGGVLVAALCFVFLAEVGS